MPLIVVLGLQGCGSLYAPEIARDVGADPGGFDKRVKTTFPIGLAEADLVATLKSQGFQIEASTASTRYAFHENWCSGWSVEWTVDQRRRVASIKGQEPRCAGP